MRPIFPGDLDHAVRALLAVEDAARPALARTILDRADTADRYRKRIGRAHPWFGTGSVLSATGRLAKAPLPDTCDAAYCAALAQVIEAVLEHKQR